MGKFNIGDKVVALTTSENPPHTQPRVKGQIYTVCDIMFCSGCGVQMVNTGVSLPPTVLSNVVCDCGNVQPNRGLYFSYSKHYAKIDDLEEELEEAVHNEDYELASILRDVKLV